MRAHLDIIIYNPLFSKLARSIFSLNEKKNYTEGEGEKIHVSLNASK